MLINDGQSKPLWLEEMQIESNHETFPNDNLGGGVKIRSLESKRKPISFSPSIKKYIWIILVAEMIAKVDGDRKTGE